MQIDDIFTLLLAALVGGALGGFFFGGLWWTVRAALASERPALWHLGSLLLRMGLTLVGFYLVGAGRWERLLACLLGFLLVRMIVVRATRPRGRAGSLQPEEVGHASQS